MACALRVGSRNKNSILKTQVSSLEPRFSSSVVCDLGLVRCELGVSQRLGAGQVPWASIAVLSVFLPKCMLSNSPINDAI